MVGLTINSTRVPYDESIGDFVAGNKSIMDNPTPVSNSDTLTSQCYGIEAHRNHGGTNARVDTLMAVVIAENTDRQEGWQYTGALLYDLKIPNPGPW